jgi:hypothetical protein
MEPVTKHHENILRMKKVVNDMPENGTIFFLKILQFITS